MIDICSDCIHQGLSKHHKVSSSPVTKVKIDFGKSWTTCILCLWKPFFYFFYFAALSSSRSLGVRRSVRLYVRWLVRECFWKLSASLKFCEICDQPKQKKIIWSNKNIVTKLEEKFVIIAKLLPPESVVRQSAEAMEKMVTELQNSNCDKTQPWNCVLFLVLFASFERFVVSCMLADPGGAALQTPPS